MRGNHPDLCRTIKHHDRTRRGRNEITPSSKFIKRLQKLHPTWNSVVLYMKKVFYYNPTKGWYVQRRNRS